MYSSTLLLRTEDLLSRSFFHFLLAKPQVCVDAKHLPLLPIFAQTQLEKSWEGDTVHLPSVTSNHLWGLFKFDYLFYVAPSLLVPRLFQNISIFFRPSHIPHFPHDPARSAVFLLCFSEHGEAFYMCKSHLGSFKTPANLFGYIYIFFSLMREKLLLCGPKTFHYNLDPISQKPQNSDQ